MTLSDKIDKGWLDNDEEDYVKVRDLKESIKKLKKEMWKDCDKWEENINKIFGDALCVKEVNQAQ